MTAEFLEVIPNSEARERLGETAARFRREGVNAAPVVFGSHRKPEGVMLSFPLFERLLPALEEIHVALAVQARLANSSATGTFDELVDELGFERSDFE